LDINVKRNVKTFRYLRFEPFLEGENDRYVEFNCAHAMGTSTARNLGEVPISCLLEVMVFKGPTRLGWQVRPLNKRLGVGDEVVSPRLAFLRQNVLAEARCMRQCNTLNIDFGKRGVV